jgi:stearoyl-CoA desaturase (delta-9 desaturase)
MKNLTLKDIGFYLSLVLAGIGTAMGITHFLGAQGLFGEWLQEHTLLKIGVFWIGMAHLTITCMSIAFHRAHTHQSVKLHPWVDHSMQTFLWFVTSMSKLDWVSVHVYHHTYSDTPKDPHSPAQKGLAHVFFMGAFDYSRAKTDPEVLKIRNRIPANAYERFIARHLFMAPLAMAVSLMVLFGPAYGLLLSGLLFLISPIFAVGGVNALAHAFGYQNYDAKDESRNLGFLFPLNWIICGELDHNNHHKFPRSPSFRHRWFEFDIGWAYITLMRWMGLCRVTGKVPVYTGDAASLNSQSEVAFVTRVS